MAQGTSSEVAQLSLLGAGSLPWAPGSDPAAGQLRGVPEHAPCPHSGGTLAALVPEPDSKTTLYATFRPRRIEDGVGQQTVGWGDSGLWRVAQPVLRNRK